MESNTKRLLIKLGGALALAIVLDNSPAAFLKWLTTLSVS